MYAIQPHNPDEETGGVNGGSGSRRPFGRFQSGFRGTKGRERERGYDRLYKPRVRRL